MILSGLKKLAADNGMKVAHGVAYGSLGGYAASMSEGSGFKQITFSTKVADRDALLAAINQVDVQRNYRVQALNVAPNGIQVVFLDNPGTMKKISAFLEWFLPLLGQFEATTANICSECGADVTSGRWIMIDGVAYHMHDACAQKVRQEIVRTEEEEKQNREGSYGAGAFGAFMGAALGAVAWAAVLLMGYVASLVGLLIGWLAEKGYNLCKGKQGKGKIAVLIGAVIFGVVLGNLGAYAMVLIQEGGSVADIPVFIAYLLSLPEFLRSFLSDIGVGLLFAGLGVYGILRKAGQQVSGTKIIDLE